MIKKIQSWALLFTIFSVSCNTKNSYEGIWRGELQVQDKQAPFLFELKNAHPDTTTVTLINGEERVELQGVKFVGDTILIPIVDFDAYIKATIKGNKMEGFFVKNYIENDAGIPFRAEFDNKNRFEHSKKPTNVTIDGKWDILFIASDGDTVKNVGIFKSSQGIVTGTILTQSGDLRFLEGAYTEKGVELSAFAGLSPYYLQLDNKDEKSFEGYFFNTRNKTKLVATRNFDAGLNDPYNIAKLRKGVTTLGFNLPNLEGEKISLQHEKYKGKVVIISILGSWCPNCLDEAAFLAPWYDANKQRGVEIIGLGFERKDDFEYSKKALTRLKNKYKINYEILFAGQAGKQGIETALPEIENFSGYPTTLFIDKKGNVRKIHTGFNGPASGLFYEAFKKDFNTLVDSLLAE